MGNMSKWSGPKVAGISILLISAILASIVWSYTFELKKADSMECQSACGSAIGSVCPYANWLPIQSYLGFTSIVALAILGIMLFFRGLGQEPITDTEQKMKRILKDLIGEEKIIFKQIVESKGAAFQGDIVNETGFSKVKVSRLLDRMEARGIIEKRRRGLTNIVIVR